MLGVIAGYFSFLLALGLILRATNPTFLPTWQPLSGRSGLMTTWQVQAALVAAALPFLFVLFPLVPDDALAVRRTAQVLMADTLIYPILVFGLGGTIWTGAAALWLGNDSSVWLAFLLVLLPTALGVGFAYSAASRIISDPEHVRRQSMQLLLKIMDDALVQQRSRTYANGELLDLLETRGVRKSELLPPEDAIPIPALREGALRDVDRVNLTAWLDELAQLVPEAPQASFQTGDIAPGQVLPASREHQVWWRPLIGNHLQVGHPIALLPTRARDALDPEELATTLDRCLKVI